MPEGASPTESGEIGLRLRNPERLDYACGIRRDWIALVESVQKRLHELGLWLTS